mmetsp:Transcript_5314/g.16728  ORF Transcript_5314/g.16728 Transcript_5314/m.16728 type:complete len:223 (+) Transcript_5314:624-1292(+)
MCGWSRVHRWSISSCSCSIAYRIFCLLMNFTALFALLLRSRASLTVPYVPLPSVFWNSYAFRGSSLRRMPSLRGSAWPCSWCTLLSRPQKTPINSSMVKAWCFVCCASWVSGTMVPHTPSTESISIARAWIASLCKRKTVLPSASLCVFGTACFRKSSRASSSMRPSRRTERVHLRRAWSGFVRDLRTSCWSCKLKVCCFTFRSTAPVSGSTFATTAGIQLL